MKLIFRLTGKEVGTVLAKHIVKENGWENDLTSWNVSLVYDLLGNVEIELERVPVKLGAKAP